MPYTTDLKQTPGKANPGGLMTKAFWVAVADLDLATPLVLSAVGKLDFAGPIVLAAGAKFIELYCTPQKGKLDDTSIGEVDGKSKEMTYEFFFPGESQACDEFEAYAMNTPCVMIIPTPNGKKRILGLNSPDPATTEINANIPCYLEASNGSSGAAFADLKGKTFQFKHWGRHAPLYYTGTIDVT